MTEATTDYPMDRFEAYKAAAMDSRYLITPRARKRALAALGDGLEPLDCAAKLILLDGGAQQGLWSFPGWSMDEWRMAADQLDKFVEANNNARARGSLILFDDDTHEHWIEEGPTQ